MNIATIRHVEAKARQYWEAKPDGKIDSWDAFHKALKAGVVTGGDCEDLATTVAQLLIEDGLPLEDGYFLLVDSNGDKRGDHLVGGCKVENDGRVIFGDSLTDGPYGAHLMKHRPIAYFRLSEMVLRDGLPWERVN